MHLVFPIGDWGMQGARREWEGEKTLKYSQNNNKKPTLPGYYE